MKTGIYWYNTTEKKKTEELLEIAAARYWGATEKGENRRLVRPAGGKPRFINAPGEEFSVSHSGDWWVCALADRPVGIDLQQHTRLKGEEPDAAASRYGRMAARFFHPEEKEYVLEKDVYRRFFRIWAAKESYVKYTGQGINSDFGKFSVLPEGGFRLEEKAGKTLSWRAAGAWFIQVPAPPGYTLCFCSAGKAEVTVSEF